jgi:signal transduction histidine kinase
VAGLSLPLAVAALQASGLTVAPPDWNAAVTATLMLTAIGAVVAFYAWSLDAVMREAEGSRVALADANDQLSYALREAQSANHVKTQIVATVSHELRTPLTAILGHTDMLRAGLYGSLNDEQQHAVERAYTNSERLLRLINDLLDFSQLDGSKLSIRPEEMPLYSTVQDVAAMVQPAVAAKGLTLNLSFDQALPSMMVADPLRLRQVLLKLLENAVSYTESGSITLLVRRQALGDPQQQRDAVVFQVRDTGAGIPPRELALVFEPFRHSSTNPPATGGSGLGLTIVQQLVQAMGGTIEVTSFMGYGSTFTVTLPLEEGGD